MRGNLKQAYITMATAAAPVLLLTIASFRIFGIGYADPQPPERSIALLFFALTFVALGISISMFKASLECLRQQLNNYAFESIMRKRITPLMFFVFGFVVGLVLSMPANNTSSPTIDDIETMRQLIASVLVVFTGAAAANSMKSLHS